MNSQIESEKRRIETELALLDSEMDHAWRDRGQFRGVFEKALEQFEGKADIHSLVASVCIQAVLNECNRQRLWRRFMELA